MFLPDPPPPRTSVGLKLPIAVIGAGITGLSAAHALAKEKVAVRVFEASNRVGGVIRSERDEGGWLIEAGPNTLQVNSRALSQWLDDLGLRDQIQAANPAAKKRYVVKRKKLLPVPLSPAQLLTTRLLSVGGKVGLLKDFFCRPKERLEDLPLAEFVEAHVGREAVRVALDPITSGIYAGDPQLLSAKFAFPTLWEAERTHGSIIRGFQAQAKSRRQRGEPPASLISFAEGLEALPRAAAAALPAGTIELGAQVDWVQPGRLGAPGMIHWSRHGISHSEPVAAVILALPARALARLPVGTSTHLPFAGLSAIPSPALTSLFLGFARSQVSHPLDGFGALIPSSELSPILGILFNSTLFPGRAPADHVALTIMVGGTRRPDLAGLDDDVLLEKVLPELEVLLGVRGKPAFMRRHRWPHAIPQYNVGHEAFVESIFQVEQTYENLFVGGQVCDGIGLPHCFVAGQRLAQRALG